MTQKTIVLSAGGTGGHLFPAEALAQELLARGHKVIIFTDKRGEAFKSLGERVEIHAIPAATLKSGLVAKLKALRDNEDRRQLSQCRKPAQPQDGVQTDMAARMAKVGRIDIGHAAILAAWPTDHKPAGRPDGPCVRRLDAARNGPHGD